jgi:hypothetical protein
VSYSVRNPTAGDFKQTPWIGAYTSPPPPPPFFWSFVQKYGSDLVLLAAAVVVVIKINKASDTGLNGTKREKDRINRSMNSEREVRTSSGQVKSIARVQIGQCDRNSSKSTKDSF